MTNLRENNRTTAVTRWAARCVNYQFGSSMCELPVCTSRGWHK